MGVCNHVTTGSVYIYRNVKNARVDLEEGCARDEVMKKPRAYRYTLHRRVTVLHIYINIDKSSIFIYI